jgi:hypothetical protein|tara:strand:- start:716 stop:1369 length:654 start_codon:yes stop_codon:yes gene_type:complete
MTIITCDCGELEVHFATTKPLFRLICCCNDCNAVLHWAAWKSGHAFYPASQGIDKIYLQNSLKIVKGEENLRWVKITPGTLCLRGVATCCYSSLFVENLSILGPKIVCVDVDFCKVKGAETSEVTAQIFEKDIPGNRKRAVCDGFSGPRFEEGPEDTPMWPDVIPTITKAQSNEFIIPDGFGSIRDIIEKSVNKHGWIHLEGYNDNGSPPIILTGST